MDDRVRAFEDHLDGLLISLVGPGTGKTYSFLQRIEALVSNNRAQSQEICYLTFIRDIANAFLSDYQEKFQESFDSEAHKPRISTLHSLACHLICNRGFSIGYEGPLYFSSIADRDLPASQVFLNDLLPIVLTPELYTIPHIRSILEQAKESCRNNDDIQSFNYPRN